MMAFCTYCEFTLSIMVYAPVHVISVYILSMAQKDNYDSVNMQVSEDLKHFTSDQTNQNMNRAITVTLALILMKYLQQLDVC